MNECCPCCDCQIEEAESSSLTQLIVILPSSSVYHCELALADGFYHFILRERAVFIFHGLLHLLRQTLRQTERQTERQTASYVGYGLPRCEKKRIYTQTHICLSSITEGSFDHNNK